MKKIFVFLIAVGLAGCQLDAIQKTGEYCPPRGLEGYISYIENAETCNAENRTDCTIYGNSHQFETHFANGICPEEYPKCVSETTDEGVTYHCEKDTKVVCGGDDVLDCRDHDTLEGTSDTSACILKIKDETCGANQCDAENYGGTDCTAIGKHCQKLGPNQYECVCDEGELSCSDSCIDPSKDETCGANQCDVENYGGVDCTISESRCKLKGETYSCVCNNNALGCDNECIDPRDEKTCGAHDCSLENYGGMDCGQIENMRCLAGDNETYSCQCAEGYILCDGKCIASTFDNHYCGASGACSSPDSSSPDFKGLNCEAGGGRCNRGKCECTFGYWCTLEGSDQPQCVNPNAQETCNAVFDESTGICTITPCQENEQCKAKSSTEYFCDVMDCPETEQLCPEIEGNVCYSLYDIEHCGACHIKCINFENEKYQAVGCEDNGGSPACTFECRNHQTNCGTAFDPVCVDITSDIKNCGTCGTACSSSQYCENGQCLNTNCAENECTSKDSNGEQVCVNHDAQCGPNCTPCKNIHDNSYCLNGTCVISECNDGEHPIFNSTGHITECRKNSTTACAPTHRKTSDPIVNCETSKGANVGTVKCGDDGYCAIVSCVNGYHLSSDKASCVQNSISACGSSTSSTTITCAIDNAASQVCLDDGTCKVTNCNAGYHLSSDSRSCVANSNTLCGATNSSSTTNCQSISNISTVTCTNGTCKVTACASGYHPNSGYTACTVNSATACGTTTSSTIQNCDTTINNSASTKCDAGTCKVTKCASGYHPNSSYTGCVANSSTACGTTTSSTTKNCSTSITNSAATKCDAGTCKVTKCATNYHPNSGYTACTANSTTACGSTTSATTTDCTAIANSVTRACSSGKCTVSKCASGYHLNSGKTGCTKNSNTSCAKVNSNAAVDCTAKTYEKVCNSSGTCACTSDGSKVLNYDKNACVIPACSGLPGVKAGTLRKTNFYNSSYSDYACQATACSSGYELYTNDGGSGAKNCRPKSGTCNAGYVNAESCNACCGHSKCKTGYRYYIMACFPEDVCCGTRNTDMKKPTDYTCKNCAALGKTCNTSTGNCV